MTSKVAQGAWHRRSRKDGRSRSEILKSRTVQIGWCCAWAPIPFETQWYWCEQHGRQHKAQAARQQMLRFGDTNL